MELGMATVERELEAERRNPCNSLLGVTNLMSSRQEVLTSRIEAAADSTIDAEFEEILPPRKSILQGENPSDELNMMTNQPKDSPFAQVLSLFLIEASSKQLKLKILAEESQEKVKDVVRWLGENPSAEVVAVFETVLEFANQFDQSFARMSKFVFEKERARE